MNGKCTKESLSQEQKGILKEFREKVQDVLKQEHDDYFLLRWLRARDFDQNKAELMLRKSLNWRKQIGADSLLESYEVPEVVLKYVRTALLGFDKEGSTVRILPQGNMDYKGLVASVRRHDLIKSLAFTYEYDLREMRINNEKTGRRCETFVFILDYAGFSIKQVASKAVMDVIFELLRIFEANYPERLKTAFVINVPPLFSTLFAAVKPLLAEETRKKFVFFGKDGWKDALLKCIDSDVLPVYLGGSRVDENGDPTCPALIPAGGTIPESCYIRNQASNRLSQLSTCSKFVVECKSVYPVEIHVPKKDSLIEWELEADGEIGIGLLYLNKVYVPGQNDHLYPMEEVAPAERLCCHLGSEAGSFCCGNSGFYILQLDNSFSKFRQKTVYFHYKVTAPRESERTAEDGISAPA